VTFDLDLENYFRISLIKAIPVERLYVAPFFGTEIHFQNM